MFRYDYAAIKRKDLQFKKFPEIHNGKNNLVYIENQVTNKTQSKSVKCEVIHVGVVCSGFKSNLYFHTMLKSIYFYRNNPLHFHILVNRLSYKVLKTLIETWAVPQGKTTINFFCSYLYTESNFQSLVILLYTEA